MNVWIVVETKTSTSMNELEHMSYENKSDALAQAVDVANGSNGFGDDVKLQSVYKIDLTFKTVEELQITITDGRFDLTKKEDK
ncbi:hypothetical protein [Virgibacillus kimchii]